MLALKEEQLLAGGGGGVEGVGNARVRPVGGDDVLRATLMLTLRGPHAEKLSKLTQHCTDLCDDDVGGAVVNWTRDDDDALLEQPREDVYMGTRRCVSVMGMNSVSSNIVGWQENKKATNTYE